MIVWSPFDQRKQHTNLSAKLEAQQNEYKSKITREKKKNPLLNRTLFSVVADNTGFFAFNFLKSDNFGQKKKTEHRE